MSGPFLKVLRPGPLCTVQDLGRKGYMAWGVPESGAADVLSLRIANMMVGNPAGIAALEITMGGFSGELLQDAVVAIYGGACEIKLDGNRQARGLAISTRKGSTLDIGAVSAGCRVYLAARGGIDVPEVLGSKSTYIKAALGGYKGRALLAGDVLECGKHSSLSGLFKLRKSEVPYSLAKEEDGTCLIRVIPGTMPERFAEEAMAKLASGTYEVSPNCDRMGIRLVGPKISHRQGADILSGGIEPGAIQVPGNGEPIILMADRQTTGGYTKLCSVISADRPKLGQLRPSDIVRFEAVDVASAHRAYIELEEKLSGSFEKVCSDKSKWFLIKVGEESFNVEVEELA